MFISFSILIYYLITIFYKQSSVITTNISIDGMASSKQLINISNRTLVDCARYKFNSNLTHSSLPIYDFFVFHDELDILEIRLNETYDYVTFFLIAESSVTFSGKDKPFYLKDNWSRFVKYHNKIRRIEVELERNVKAQWSNEHRMRNEGLRLAQATITE